MGILKSEVVAVTTTGVAGSGAGNANSSPFVGEIVGFTINHDPNAPSTTDLTITDRRTGVTILNMNNANTDVYVTPRKVAVDSTNTNILASTANALWPTPYIVDQGVNVAIAQGNSITNHCVVTVHYRR